MNPRIDSIGNKQHWFLFSFILSIFIAFESLFLFALDEGLDSALMVFLYISAVSLLYLVFAFFLSMIWKLLWPIFISLFIAFSLLELKLIYVSGISGLQNMSLLLIIVSVSVLLYILLSRTRAFRRPTLILYVLSFIIFVGAPVAAFQLQDNDIKLSASEAAFINQLSKVKFKDTPNVYILFYDSMIPPLTARKYLGIEKLGYDSVLEKDFIRLGPTASIGVPSKPSLNGVMRLDQEKMTRINKNYFNGKKPSPLATLFSNNGYRVTTGFSNYYFGEKGPYIDRYIVMDDRPLVKTTQCIDVGKSILQRLRSFGVCESLGDYSIFYHLKRFAEGIDIYKDYTPKPWPSQVFKEIQSASSSNRPELKIFYTYRPNGHTPGDYRHSDLEKRESYKNYFNKGARRLSGILEELVTLIKSDDPKSLVLVFGDHGAWLSREVRKKDNPKFFMEDRHIVDSAVMVTQHPCAKKKILSKNSPGYFTPSRIVVSLIDCLASDQSLEEILTFDEPSDLVELLKHLKD